MSFWVVEKEQGKDDVVYECTTKEEQTQTFLDKIHERTAGGTFRMKAGRCAGMGELYLDREPGEAIVPYEITMEDTKPKCNVT